MKIASRSSFALLSLAIWSIAAAPARAELRLPHLFGDNMVLQCQQSAPVWGWATAGEEVTVSAAGVSQSAKADAAGRWQVNLPELPIGGPIELVVRSASGSSIVCRNVLVGEVWIGSGQSNMDMPIGNLNVRDAERKTADWPQIRQFMVERVQAGAPQSDCNGKWVACSPESVWDFSAVCYYFGRRLHQDLKRPVGLIVSSKGGTPIEPWSSRKSLENDPEVKPLRMQGSELYNSMIAPLVPYGVRGMIWYQGETNVSSAANYRALLSAMIRDRRSDWGRDLPVGIVQIAPFRYAELDPACEPELWEAETQTHRALANTGLIVTTDLSETNEIHPQRKAAVGERAAMWAKSQVYGQAGLIYAGPLYKSMSVEGSRLRLQFDHAESGLASRDGQPLSHFTIAGDDQVFHPALAEVDGASIVVSSPDVPHPVAARFAWRDDAQANLVNKGVVNKNGTSKDENTNSANKDGANIAEASNAEGKNVGLPAMPFRTDAWRRVTDSVTVPHFFADHMVLQRDMPVPIWGWAGPGRKVKVTFDANTYHAVANAKGQWRLDLPAMEAGGPHHMTVGDRYTMGNVMVGEVWLCAGQSNIEKPIGPHPGQTPCLDWEREIATADYPQIRLLEVPPARANEPAGDVDCKWLSCSPQNIVVQRGGGHGFSAAAYFFGRELHKELKIPIGLIAASASGTRCEPWTPGLVSANGDRPALFNGMIAPLVPLAMRGVVWYQGESNMGDGRLYDAKMRALIGGWRRAWGAGDFPFYYVQLPNYRCGGDALPRLREAQAATLAVPNTGMAVTLDIGSYPDCHCPNKQDVGKRLALWALAKNYGRSDLVYSGPFYKSMAIEGDKLRLRFDHTGGGLTTRDGAAELSAFEIAGADGKFVPAAAKIDGESVVVTSPAITQPAAARFAWDEQATSNFINKAGLPAAPFRTNPERD